MEGLNDRHQCASHAKFNVLARKSLSWILAKQWRVSMETAVWPKAHKPTDKSDNVWSEQVRCRCLCCAWRILHICEVSVYLLKIKFSSVLQWIKDALTKKHSSMTSGTELDWTAHSALDHGVIKACLILREPCLNPYRQLAVNKFEYANIFGAFFRTLLALMHIGLILPACLQNCFEIEPKRDKLMECGTFTCGHRWRDFIFGISLLCYSTISALGLW